jgi:Domain of unknown function (DUF397)
MGIAVCRSAKINDGIAVRDSIDKRETLLLCPAAAWREFVAAIRQLDA